MTARKAPKSARRRSAQSTVTGADEVVLTSEAESLQQSTIAPGLGGTSGSSSMPLEDGTSYKPIFEDAKGVSAPVAIPSEEELRQDLVRSDLVYALEQSRSDQTRFENFIFTIVGAMLGIATQADLDPTKLTATSKAFLLLFVVLFVLCIWHLATLNSRVTKTKADMERSKRSARVLLQATYKQQ
jgi:hypothetical protein